MNRNRLRRRSDNALFGYAVGPYSWKKFLFPPVQRLWRARREGEGFEMETKTSAEPRYAFFGVRPCELQAIEVLDRVFGKDTHVDPLYLSRRENIFVVAVNCGHAGGSCFCVSMQTGPRQLRSCRSRCLSAQSYVVPRGIGSSPPAHTPS
jgi:sulfhydrogenase subunit beta (sulfur reductase)